MHKNKKRTSGERKLDEDNYLNIRTVCKSCYDRNKRKNYKNTSHHNQRSKVLITITIELSIDQIQPRSPRTPRP